MLSVFKNLKELFNLIEPSGHLALNQLKLSLNSQKVCPGMHELSEVHLGQRCVGFRGDPLGNVFIRGPAVERVDGIANHRSHRRAQFAQTGTACVLPLRYIPRPHDALLEPLSRSTPHFRSNLSTSSKRKQTLFVLFWYRPILSCVFSSWCPKQCTQYQPMTERMPMN